MKNNTNMKRDIIEKKTKRKKYESLIVEILSFKELNIL